MALQSAEYPAYIWVSFGNNLASGGIVLKHFTSESVFRGIQMTVQIECDFNLNLLLVSGLVLKITRADTIYLSIYF